MSGWKKLFGEHPEHRLDVIPYNIRRVCFSSGTAFGNTYEHNNKMMVCSEQYTYWQVWSSNPKSGRLQAIFFFLQR